MTDQEAEILVRLMPPKGERAVFKALREIGGTKGSTHSVTAMRMRLKGWIERERRGGGSVRPAYAFKITDAGRQALHNHLLPAIERRRKTVR